VPATLAGLSIFSVPVCGLVGYLLATTNEADFIGLGWFLSIYVGIVIGAVGGLVMLKKSKDREEDADLTRTLGLIVNWGALIFFLGLPLLLR
jgi:glucose uptake protein GlcU